MTQPDKALFETAEATNSGTFSPGEWTLFLSIALIWGSSFLLIAEALEGLTPQVITFGRVSLGALVVGLMRIARPPKEPMTPNDRRRLLLLSFLWVAIPFTLFPLAQEHINSAVTGLLNGATPIFVAVISAVLLKQRTRGAQLLGILIGFAGVMLISLSSAGGESSEARGVLLVLGATVCYGFAINLAAPLQARYGAIQTMSGVLFLATVWVLPFTFWNFGDNVWSIGPIAAVIFLGAVGTGLAYWIMATLVGRVGGLRASFITYLIPVVSLVLGVTFRGDDVQTLALVGAGLTIGGALLASRSQR